MKKKLPIVILVLFVVLAVTAVFLASEHGGGEGGIVAKAEAPLAEAIIKDPALDHEMRARRVGATTARYVRNEAIYDRSTSLLEHVNRFRDEGILDASASYDIGSQIAVCVASSADMDSIEQLAEGNEREVQVAGVLLDVRAYCQGLSDDDIAFAFELLDRAVVNGLDEAQVSYVHFGRLILKHPRYRLDDQAIRHYKHMALSSLQSAASRGNASAYFNLSQVYEDGSIVARDAQMALAMYREYLRISQNSSVLAQRRLYALEAAIGD